MKLQGDTLSRQYLLAEIDDLADEFAELDENGLHSERWCGISDSKRIIINAPTLEPKHGKWIFKTVFPNDKSEFPMGYLVCSVCGSHHSNSTPCNYCDNCGADMRERQENE